MKPKKIIEADVLKKIEKAYIKGQTYKQIAKKHGITENQLKVLIKKHKWKRPRNTSKVKKGNKNAAGNKGNKNARPPKNNKNAVVTGAYENIYDTLLDEDEKIIMEQYQIIDEIAELRKQLKTLTLREYRMLAKIKKYKDKNTEITISKIGKRNLDIEYTNTSENQEETTSEGEITDNIILRIEEALTKVQEAKRKCIEALHKMELSNKKFELELELSGLNGEEVEDLSEVDGDIYGSA